ncbi:MAG: aminotransferase class V-fold PLP-dependent enzyme [Bacteroidota bacterium]
MEQYFTPFKQLTLGDQQFIKTPYHQKIRILYADWIASGRMYGPIEERLNRDVFPLVANTHTDTNNTGSSMTYLYHKAQQFIKQHVGASEEDILITTCSGMTGVVNKFQRILGLKVHESFQHSIDIPKQDRPIVFITHMEHHSNQTSWLETIADVEIIQPTADGLVSLHHFKELLQKYANRRTKIAAITSCSNVTGIMTPYLQLAKMIHQEGGYCFVDFACSAPYVDIDMHPDDASGKYLDAIYFSPHKFLGGPGSTGVLIFNQKLYQNKIPDNPGGGTVDWTNPWGQHKYLDNIEAREDGGTPAFLQTIKAAMCMRLKEEMTVEAIHLREQQLLEKVWKAFDQIPNLHVLADQHRNRLGVISFYIDGLHYNVGVKMLNDRFGIQVRGGCSCAGTYGHYLLNVSPDQSDKITSKISSGDCSSKPGWIRMSIHPTHSDEEVDFMLGAIQQLATHFSDWAMDYEIDLANSFIRHKNEAALKHMEREMDSVLDSSFSQELSFSISKV